MIRRLWPLVALLAIDLAFVAVVAIRAPWLLLPIAGTTILLVALFAAGGDALFGRRE